MSGENTANTLPTLDQCKSHLKELIKTFVPQVENSKGELIPDVKEIAKLNSHVQDACKMALLIAGSNTGFIKGIRNESRADIVPLNQAFDKKGNLKNGLVEDIFWSPVATFPMRNDGTEKAPVVIKNSDVHRPCTINSVRESFGVHFEGKKLNAGRYALDKEESTRDKTEQGFVLTNRFEDGDVEMMLVKDDTASKNCLNAIEQFIKTFQNKKLNAEQEIKSAIENEKAELDAKKERMKKAS